MKNNQKGATMLEAIATISVVTVLAIASIRLIGNLFDMFKQNTVANEIREIQKNITSRFALEGNYETLKGDAEYLQKERLVPNQMIANKKIYHRLGGKVTIATDSTNNLHYQVTFDSLNNRGCLNLAQINWVINQGTDLVAIQVNAKKFEQPVGNLTAGENTLPLTMEKAAKVCNNKNDNTITWTFQ